MKCINIVRHWILDYKYIIIVIIMITMPMQELLFAALTTICRQQRLSQTYERIGFDYKRL